MQVVFISLITLYGFVQKVQHQWAMKYYNILFFEIFKSKCPDHKTKELIKTIKNEIIKLITGMILLKLLLQYF